ncbi:MAG: hypothetical protein CMH60_04480 [Myxococcales bacterium]|nr:hypothetical protein [Myxococcales bacterium]|tara:strand:- start:63 stop:938 length:876 start_codon:yes stop_codon:yes gene_type:complete
MRRPHKLASFVLILSALALSTGCWSKRTDYYNATFSDDDTSIVYVRDRYEQKKCCRQMFIGSLPTRNHRYQLFTQNLDGSNQRPLGNEDSKGMDGDIYYMKAAGYVLVSRTTTTDSGVSAKSFARIDLASGLETEVASEPMNADPNVPGNFICSWRNMIPSPDGSVIAVISEPSTCTQMSASVEFLNGSTLASMGTQEISFGGDLVDPNYHRALLYRWSPEGKFEIGNNTTTDGTYVLTPGGEMTDAPMMTCDWPKTTSSQYSAAGQYVQIGSSDGTPSYQSDGTMSFPCE